MLVRFAHASAQWVADSVGVDVVHIKGPSLDPELNPGRPQSWDADVMVRPSQVDTLMDGLQQAGWSLWCDFEEGSLFEHAASFHSERYGMLDVHQNFPGLHRHPEEAFEALWQGRVRRSIGGIECWVPGPTQEHLIMLLHAARTPGRTLDVDNHWNRLDAQDRSAVEALAVELGAEVGLRVATRGLDRVSSPEADLWRHMLDNSDRLGEWQARWRNTDGFRARAKLLWRAAHVNRFTLEQRLGTKPTRADVMREWLRRAGAGLASVPRLVRERR